MNKGEWKRLGRWRKLKRRQKRSITGEVTHHTAMGPTGNIEAFMNIFCNTESSYSKTQFFLFLAGL